MGKCEFCEKSCGNSWCSYAGEGVKLEIGKTYTIDIVDLALTVLDIKDETSDSYRIKGKVFNKKNNIVYETQDYKIDKKVLEYWKLV